MEFSRRLEEREVSRRVNAPQLETDPSKLDSKMEQLHHSEKEIQKHSDIMSQLKSRMVSGSRTD